MVSTVKLVGYFSAIISRVIFLELVLKVKEHRLIGYEINLIIIVLVMVKVKVDTFISIKGANFSAIVSFESCSKNEVLRSILLVRTPLTRMDPPRGHIALWPKEFVLYSSVQISNQNFGLTLLNIISVFAIPFPVAVK